LLSIRLWYLPRDSTCLNLQASSGLKACTVSRSHSCLECNTVGLTNTVWIRDAHYTLVVYSTVPYWSTSNDHSACRPLVYSGNTDVYCRIMLAMCWTPSGWGTHCSDGAPECSFDGPFKLCST
jgi:hypothetical protein